MSHPYDERPHDLGGIHRLYKFPNGFGASVVRFRMGLPSLHKYGSYTNGETEWEVAIVRLKPREPGCHFDVSFDIAYDTPLTADVIGHVKDGAELEELLDKIAALPTEVSVR